MIVERANARWVLDAKYKCEFGDESRVDRFQMCTYALVFDADLCRWCIRRPLPLLPLCRTPRLAVDARWRQGIDDRFTNPPVGGRTGSVPLGVGTVCVLGSSRERTLFNARE